MNERRAATMTSNRRNDILSRKPPLEAQSAIEFSGLPGTEIIIRITATTPVEKINWAWDLSRKISAVIAPSSTKIIARMDAVNKI